MMRAERLLRATELLIDEINSIEDKSYNSRDELAEVLSEYIEELFLVSNIQELEQRITNFKKIDVENLFNLLNVILSYEPKAVTLNFSNGESRVVDPNELETEIRSGLDVISKNQKQLGELEILLRIELYFDRAFTDLLSCFQFDSEVYVAVKEIIAKKLKLINDDEVLMMWARLKAQFQQDRNHVSFQVYDDIIPNNFFDDPLDPEEIRGRYIDFICKYKPHTVVRMINEGLYSSPAGLAGVARISSLNASQDLRKISNLEVLLVRSLSRLVALYEKLTYKEAKYLAKSINTDPESFIFTGEYFSSYLKVLDSSKNRAHWYSALILNMKRTFEYAQEYSVQRSNVSDALWYYKLGQEVIAPSRNIELLKQKSLEISLQREVCKYLVERGILAYGRSFGRNQIDLFTKEATGEDFVVEVKVYKSKISTSSLISNIVQLHSYMDLSFQARGVLVIYNFTNDLIVSPRKWIRGRYWILIVNLCDVPPSKRKRTIMIEESKTSSEIINCFELDSNNVVKKTSRKAKVRKKK